MGPLEMLSTGICCRPADRQKNSKYPCILGVLCIFPAVFLLATLRDLLVTEAQPSQEDAAPPGFPSRIPPALRNLAFPPPPRIRTKRYTLTPGYLKWDHFNLTYKILSFPRNLINESQTRKGLVAAFRMWSDVSPFSFREVPPSAASDLEIGFYSINHTDCLESQIHHCFDGTTGELAHAFFPQTGEIHFDDHEYWIVGDTRFSWKKGVWLTDLVHVAAHEIGHALGLMHSLDPNALMHLNATLTGKNKISQDEMWGIFRLYGEREEESIRRLPGGPFYFSTNADGLTVSLPENHHVLELEGFVEVIESDPLHSTGDYSMCAVKPSIGCKDQIFICPTWTRRGYCKTRTKFMKKYCPYSCDFCIDFPFPTVPPTIPPPRLKTRIVPEGRNVTFRCGQKIIHKKGKVYWYKDKELLEYSYPGYLSLNEDHMSIIANAINEGTYTCLVKKKSKILTTYSWRVKVKQ